MLQVPGNNLMGGIDMTTAAPANVANVANAAAAQGGVDFRDSMAVIMAGK